MALEMECRICQGVAYAGHNPRLITDMDVSFAILNRDQFLKGYSIVVYKKHATELYHLSSNERMKFCEEMIQVANAIDKTFRPDNMNYELLGNMEAHMHWHLLPRYKNDGFWGLPVWVRRHKPKELTDEEYQSRAAEIRRHL